MKKIIIITWFAAMSSQYVSAQAEHEVSVNAGGGLSALLYKPSQGTSNAGGGGEFGVGYTFFSDKLQAAETGTVIRAQWGIHTGLRLGLYGAKAQVNNEKAETKNLTDDEGDDFILYTLLTGYKETQRAMSLNIPVMALYLIEPYYVMAGVKINIPLTGKYKSKDATLTNEAYYIDYENWLKTQTFAGYGEFRGKKSDGSVDLGVTVMLSLEGGYKWRLNSQFVLYTGAYFDYGLNNTFKGTQTQFVNYDRNNPSGFTTNSVMSSFAQKVHLIAFGLTARLAMNL